MNSFKLKVAFCVLIFAFSCIIFGCGSDNSAGISSSKKDQKPKVKQGGKVVELLVDDSHGGDATGKPRGTVPKNIWVLPPQKPGESGITQQDIEAGLRAQKLIDLKTVELLPPLKPGEHGITQQDIEAAIKAQKNIDQQNLEVVPPSKPHGTGLTQREVEAAIKASKHVDPQNLEVVPPRKTGERGITQQETEAAMRASKPTSVSPGPGAVEVMPPKEPEGLGVNLQGK
ncbi:MAG: hypothetical protein ACOZF2_06690 [Thermodesulfobacteriota bacterium]